MRGWLRCNYFYSLSQINYTNSTCTKFYFPSFSIARLQCSNATDWREPTTNERKSALRLRCIAVPTCPGTHTHTHIGIRRRAAAPATMKAQKMHQYFFPFHSEFDSKRCAAVRLRSVPFGSAGADAFPSKRFDYYYFSSAMNGAHRLRNLHSMHSPAFSCLVCFFFLHLFFNRFPLYSRNENEMQAKLKRWKCMLAVRVSSTINRFFNSFSLVMHHIVASKRLLSACAKRVFKWWMLPQKLSFLSQNQN